MVQLDLVKLKASKDPITGRLTFTKTVHFKVGMAVVLAAFLALFVLDRIDLPLPELGDFFLAFGMTFAYAVAFIALFTSRNAGKVHLSENEISLYPKKDEEFFPASPIKINERSHIQINTIQSLRYFVPKIFLHIMVKKDKSEAEFTIKIKNKKVEQQYSEVLESWYKAGYEVMEFDQQGNRVLKLH